MTESKLEFSGVFGEPPALYRQTLAFLNIKKQQLEKNLKNSCEKVLKTFPLRYKDVTFLLMMKYFQILTILGFQEF